MGLQITQLWADYDFAARSCCELDLQGSDQTVGHDMSSHYGDHFCEIVVKSDFKYESYEPDFAARSCCDIDLQGRNPNLACDMSSQYGDHFCEIVLKSDFKKRSYGPYTILL